MGVLNFHPSTDAEGEAAQLPFNQSNRGKIEKIEDIHQLTSIISRRFLQKHL